MTDTHERLDRVAVAGGDLTVNGRLLTGIVNAAGGTPVFVYDRGLIEERIGVLRSILPQQIGIHYALKANPMPALACFVAGLVDGFDVASAGELLVALNTGTDPSRISFAGPGKTVEELRAAIAAGVIVSVESERELAHIGDIARTLRATAKVILRLNPAFQLKRAGVVMTGYPSQFGLDVELVPALVRSVDDRCVSVLGFQVYSGSQNLDAQAIVESQQQTFKLASELSAELPGGLRYLNIGGGFGIPYFAGETPLDIARVGAGLTALADEYRTLIATCEVVVELGRYLVGEAGYYVTTVTDRKVSREKTFVVVDGGLNHHLANSGNFGQVVRRNYPVLLGNKADRPPAETVTIAGPLCTPLDIVAADVAVPAVEPGDRVVVLQSGAYACSASPHQFLGRPAPREILV